MFKFRFVRLVVLALAVLLCVVGCASRNILSQAQPLRVGTNPWTGYSGHYVAWGKGLYDRAGVKVQDVPLPSDTEEIAAFLAGKLDLAWLTSGNAMQIYAKDPSSQIVFLVDYSNGADGVVARNIKNSTDLKGKTIAREDVLFEKVLLRAFLKQNGLTEKDVTIKNLTAPEAAKAFIAKQVDVAVTFEPSLTKAAKEGGGEIIFTTENTNLIADVIIARQGLLRDRQADCLAYLKAIDPAIKLVKANDAEALKIIGQRLSTTPDAVKDQLKGITLFDIDGNKSIAFTVEHPRNLIGHLELTVQAAQDFNVLSPSVKTKSVYDDTLVNSL